MPVKKPTPETLVKRQISEYIAIFHPCAMFWWNKSTGIFDKKRGVFRKAKSRFDMNGVPDILGIYRGLFFAIEVKAGKNKPSESQDKFLLEFNRRGGFGIVAYGVADVQKLFIELKELSI